MAITPGVITTAFEIERVAGSEIEELVGIENEFKAAGKHMHEFFAFMPVGAFAGSPRCQHETMAIHHPSAFRQQLHRDTGRRLRPGAPFAGADDCGNVFALLAGKAGDSGAVIFRKVVQRLEADAL